MAWTDIPFGSVTFGVFTGSAPAAAVSVAPVDLLLLRYKVIAPDTLVVDFRIKKAFFTPAGAAVTGITMELAIPFASRFFPGLGAPNPFFDQGQSYSNDCIIAFDPGSLNHAPGCVALLNDAAHKIILLIRTVNGDNLNPATAANVVGTFGQLTFEVGRKHGGNKTVARAKTRSKATHRSRRK